MMREVKFRAWDKEGKVMCEVIGINRCLGSDWHEATVNWEGKYYNRPIDKLALMQFTGLRDKSGREIYEGDILRVLKRNFAVEYHEYTGGYKVVTKEGVYRTILNSDNVQHYEVIGNIHENGDLL